MQRTGGTVVNFNQISRCRGLLNFSRLVDCRLTGQDAANEEDVVANKRAKKAVPMGIVRDFVAARTILSALPCSKQGQKESCD